MSAIEQSRETDSAKERVNIGDKGAVLLLLYNASIELLEEAKSALERGDLVEKSVYISQTHTIVSELVASLDFEVGGEVAKNLEALYLFMLDQLFEANLNNDPKPLDIVLSLLRPLYASWEAAIAAERERISKESERRCAAA